MIAWEGGGSGSGRPVSVILNPEVSSLVGPRPKRPNLVRPSPVRQSPGETEGGKTRFVQEGRVRGC